MTSDLRMQDVIHEENRMLQAIEGYQDKPLVSLEEAIVPLYDIMEREELEKTVWLAKQRCENPADGLSPDESASIMIYTSAVSQKGESFYFILNQTLRKESRDDLKPWFLYLKLFLTALSRLPCTQGTFFRGVKGDLTPQYRMNNKHAVWWGVSSCTNNIKTLNSATLCGRDGSRTIFIITCTHGRSIENHSFYPDEKEILLTPGSYFEIKGRFNSSDDLRIIQLQEIQPPHALCLLPSIPLWGERKPGICLEGICNNDQCRAYHETVIIPIGFRRFNLVSDTDEGTMKCSVCSKYVEISGASASHCRWRWEGIKQREPDKKPEKCDESWKNTDDYATINLKQQGKVTWRQLIIEAKPK